VKYVRTITTLAFLLGCAFAQAQTEVTVFTYNDRPPFVVNKAKQDGLEYRLVQWLNTQGKAYHFTLKVVTGPEAKAMVASQDLKGVLIGVSPAWFSEQVRNTWLWTPPVLWDRNVVTSLTPTKVEYTNPSALEGHTLAGVKGFVYPGIMEAVKAGKIKRTDTDSEIASLEMVAAHKVDFTIVSEWTLLYAQLRLFMDGDFYMAAKPFQAFERKVLVPPAMKELHEYLTRILADVKQNAGWQEATKV
jgi:polar amino acid transport system substrate-binding protein